MISKLTKYKTLIFFTTLFLLAVVSMAFVYYKGYNSPPIRSDGIGYYAYLPSIFIHGDLTMNKFMNERADHFNEPVPDSWSGINKLENGNYLDKYTIGIAIMMSPFFFLAHLLTIIFGFETNGFSIFYQLLVGFAGTAYMLLGLVFLYQFLKQYFNKKVVYLSLVIILFGSNLFHYGTYDSIFSHAYSFCLFAAFIYFFDKWSKQSAHSLQLTAILGFVSGLIVLVRTTNIILPITFFGFYLIKTQLSWKVVRSIAIICLLSAICYLPQLLYWKFTAGSFITNPYIGEGFDFTKFETLNVLFSIRKGLFFWSPILLIAVAGMFYVKKELRSYILSISSFLLLNLLLVSAWHHWPYGGGFGHRAFVESLALLTIPFTSIIERIYNAKSKVFKVICILLISLLVLLSTIYMFKYWEGKLKPDGTTWETFLEAFK
jgi:hypothetical protein